MTAFGSALGMAALLHLFVGNKAAVIISSFLSLPLPRETLAIHHGLERFVVFRLIKRSQGVTHLLVVSIRLLHAFLCFASANARHVLHQPNEDTVSLISHQSPRNCPPSIASITARAPTNTSCSAIFTAVYVPLLFSAKSSESLSSSSPSRSPRATAQITPAMPAASQITFTLNAPLRHDRLSVAPT